jgi:multiple sugar transport system substrate-binding protein/sn-glycerol 3-phosphate transport system substrate-binding protein
MVKKSLLLMALLALTIGFGTVFAQEDLSAVDPTGQTIIYWHEWDGAQLEAINAIIESFEASNEYGITVETVELGSSGPMADAMSAGIQSGDLPNLVGGFLSNAQSYFLDGVAVPLDPYINDPTWGFTEEERAQIDFDLIEVNRATGEVFGDSILAWPIGFSGVVMSVNLDLLGQMGFEGAPEDLETFREVACTAAEFTGPGGEDVQGFPVRTSGQDMHAFILNQGGSIWDEEAQQFDFDNETTIEVLTFFQQLVADGCAYVPESNFANTADFAYWLNPMAVGSSVGVPFIQNDNATSVEAGGTPLEPTDWVNTTQPWSEGNRTLMLNFRSVVMVAGTPEQQLATWLFLRHMASAEGQTIWTTQTFYQPYNLAALEAIDEAYLAENPQFDNMRQMVLNPDIRKYSEPQVVGWFGAADANFRGLVSRVLTEPDLDIAAAAAEAEIAANEQLAEALEALE